MKTFTVSIKYKDFPKKVLKKNVKIMLGKRVRVKKITANIIILLVIV